MSSLTKKKFKIFLNKLKSLHSLSLIAPHKKKELNLVKKPPKMKISASKKNSPHQIFLINKFLLKSLQKLLLNRKKSVSRDEIVQVAINTTFGSVKSRFTTDALNIFNAAYYSSHFAFSESIGIATMYIYNKYLNRCLAKFINKHISSEVIKIKELCSGKNSSIRWSVFASVLHSRKIYANLSDFSTPALPSKEEIGNLPDNLRIYTEEVNLLKPFPELDVNQKYDVFIATYGFDSIWFPQDFYIKRIGERWFKYFYRLKVVDNYSRRVSLLKNLISENPDRKLTIRDFENIFIEISTQEVNIDQVPYGNYIKDILNEEKASTLNFPGGLINKTVEAFKAQIKTKGIFIIGDVALYNPKKQFPNLKKPLNIMPFNTSGKIAKFKSEDYLLAKRILENEYDFKVTITGLDDLAKHYLEKKWMLEASYADRSEILQNPTNCIMLIQKKSSSI